MLLLRGNARLGRSLLLLEAGAHENYSKQTMDHLSFATFRLLALVLPYSQEVPLAWSSLAKNQ